MEREFLVFSDEFDLSFVLPVPTATYCPQHSLNCFIIAVSTISRQSIKHIDRIKIARCVELAGEVFYLANMFKMVT